MKKQEYVQYYVEGADEEKLLSVLKTEMGMIVPGKIQVFNVVQEEFTTLRLMQLKKDTTVVLVYDTDTKDASIFRKNINILKKFPYVKNIICIPQVNNLEDELIRSCCIKKIKELTGSKSNKDYKADLLKEKNLKNKLELHGFDENKLWSQIPKESPFSEFGNDAKSVKK